MGVSLNVNGEAATVDAADDDRLLWVLRDDLGLVGAKYGCGLEQCGSCRVLVDGAPASSCQVAVTDVEGRAVTTVEGLVLRPAGRAVVNALLAHNAGQCGYCLPGIVVTLTHLVEGDEVVTRDELLRVLDDHLCRCGSQPRIVRAALEALDAFDALDAKDG